MAWHELSRPKYLERGEVAGEDEEKGGEGMVNRRILLDPGQDHVALAALCLLAQRLCLGPHTQDLAPKSFQE